MADDPYTRYEPVPLKDSGGWYIVVTSAKHGLTHELHGFVSETETRNWIGKELNTRAPGTESGDQKCQTYFPARSCKN
jgi:hypothetical protein